MTYPYSTGASIVGQNMKHPSFLCIHDLTQRFCSKKSTKKINHMRREPTLPYPTVRASPASASRVSMPAARSYSAE